MRFLRMLSNAVIAGGIAATYVLILFLLLNPAVPLRSSAALPLAIVILLAYGVHLTVVFYALIVLRQLFATEILSPGWLSVRLLAWLGTIASLVAAALLWLNLWGLRPSLDEETARRFVLAASAMTACTVLFGLLAVLRYSFGRRGGPAGAVACLLLVLASIGLPLAARGGARVPPDGSRRPSGVPTAAVAAPSGRVIVLAIDGASLDLVSVAAAAGRLPNFGRLLDAGAVMHLATLRPTQPGVVWTAVATGKLPWRNGVRSAATYTAAGGGASIDLLPDYCFAHALASFGLLTEQGHTSTALRADPLWQLLGRAGLRSQVVRWPLTWPAQPVNGALISDQYHRTPELTLSLDEPLTTFPPDLGMRLRRLASAEPMTDPVTPVTADDYPGEAPMALDRQYAALAWRLAELEPADLFAMRFQGLDVVGHYYLRQAMPRAFGDVSEEERRLFGRVLEQYYRYIDVEVGRALNGLAPGDLLLVVSGFGMQPLSFPKQLLEHTLGNAALSGTHERAPDGFVLAYGSHVRPGRLPRGSVVDVTPTLLYYLGLPVGRDMDGFARTDLFTRAFTESRPIAYIPTYGP